MSKIKTQKAQISKGFMPVTSEIPDSLRGGDDEDNRLQLEGDDEIHHDLEDIAITDEVRGKRMTNRQGLEAAQKKVPAVSRPGDKTSNLFV